MNELCQITDEVRVIDNYQHYFLEKPLYGNMFFKLSYDISLKGSVKKMPVWRMDPIARKAAYKLVQELSLQIKRFADMNGFSVRTRSEGYSVNVFIETVEQARLIAKRFSDCLFKVWVPYNTKQITGFSDLIATPLFRAQLFLSSNSHPGYRYKTELRATPENKLLVKRLGSFIVNINRKDYELSKNARSLLNSKGDNLSYWNTITMYFNDEKDLLMLKLMLGAVDLVIFKVILHEELLETDK